MMRSSRRVLGALAVLSLAGCASYRPLNARLAAWEPGRIAREQASLNPGRSPDILFVLAFSGGGTRAAAFSYGVLQELAATEVGMPGDRRRLLEEVDLLAGVSGGSFTAAYYALYGDRIFTDYETRFLHRNVQLALLLRLLSPWNWLRFVSSPYFTRSMMASEYYDGAIFDGATFADLARRHGPRLLISTTDLTTGGPFTFADEMFDLICADLSSVHLGQAVAASSAVPVLFAPITLRNYAGSCGYHEPRWIRDALEAAGSRRNRARARELQSYLDARRRRFIHVVDGGISDNLGLRGPFERWFTEWTPGRKTGAFAGITRFIFVIVNAQTEAGYHWSLKDISPPLSAVLDLVTSTQINRYNLETMDLLRARCDLVEHVADEQSRPLACDVVEVAFGDERDEKERRYLNGLSTSFALSDKAVTRVKAAGRRLLRQSPDFQNVVRALGGTPAAPASP